MEQERLEQLVSEGKSQYEIAKAIGCSQTNVVYWLNKFGLKTVNVSRERKCRLCGETDSNKFYCCKDGRFRYRCRECDKKQIKARYRRLKAEAVVYKGGKCVRCGYDKCLRSLDFHHINPAQKDPDWKNMRALPLEKLKPELDKCILVCRNCHGEMHEEMDA